MSNRSQVSKSAPVELSLFLPLAPAWKTPAQAIEYLGGGFAETLFAARDLLHAGESGDAVTTLLHDLAITAEALAKSLKHSVPVKREVEASMENAAALASAVASLRSKLKSDSTTLECAGGLEHEVLGSSVRVLSDVAAEAMKAAGQDHEERWYGEQDSRNRAIDLQRRALRLHAEGELVGMNAQAFADLAEVGGAA
jgi:hypothetical protein